MPRIKAQRLAMALCAVCALLEHPRSQNRRARKRLRLKAVGLVRSFRNALDREFPIIDTNGKTKVNVGCKCPGCGHWFKTWKGLGKHFHLSHCRGFTLDGNIRCVCGREFSRNGRMSAVSLLGSHLANLKDPETHFILGNVAGPGGNP